jgi:hypothetical protein
MPDEYGDLRGIDRQRQPFDETDAISSTGGAVL